MVASMSGTSKKPLQLLEGHQNIPMHVGFNHVGDLLVSSGWDGAPRLRDPVSGKELASN
jgi:hypothetical protein